MSKQISGNYGTHLAPLIKCMELTSGDVLEMGVGYFSTPYLHYKCQLDGRKLVSIDNERGWIKRFADSEFYQHLYRRDFHEFQFVEDWKDADIEKPWTVALVDHSPSERRKEDIKRLANYAEYIVVHDANDERRFRKEYNYNEIYPLFKYKKIWTGDTRQAVVLSNFHNLDNLW